MKTLFRRASTGNDIVENNYCESNIDVFAKIEKLKDRDMIFIPFIKNGVRYEATYSSKYQKYWIKYFSWNSNCLEELGSGNCTLPEFTQKVIEVKHPYYN